MRKILLAIFILITVLLSGCAKGEITLDISRMGAADVNCKLVANPILASGLQSFKQDLLRMVIQ